MREEKVPLDPRRFKKLRELKWINPNGTSVSAKDIPPDIHILQREDGRIERICEEHGVGHPIGHVLIWKDWMYTHGCCGCCSKWGENDSNICNT